MCYILVFVFKIIYFLLEPPSFLKVWFLIVVDKHYLNKKFFAMIAETNMIITTTGIIKFP